MDIERQKEHFEEISKIYFETRQSYQNHILFKELMWRYFANKVKRFFTGRKYKCLEPMCGFGEGYKILKNYFFLDIDYKGFDYSELMVKIANEKFPDLDIVHGNILDYSDSQKYDLIILIGGLHHVYKFANDALKNINKIIKKGALFISFEPTHNNHFIKKVREQVYKKNNFFDYNTERGFDLDELNNIFIENGYQKLEQIYPGLLGYCLYYNPDAFPKLRVGNEKIVKIIFNFERLFYHNYIGKLFSFSTLTLWRKN